MYPVSSQGTPPPKPMARRISRRRVLLLLWKQQKKLKKRVRQLERQLKDADERLVQHLKRQSKDVVKIRQWRKTVDGVRGAVVYQKAVECARA